MRVLAALLVAPLLALTPSAVQADSQIATRTSIAAVEQGGLVGFRVERREERAHSYVLASGYVVLQVNPQGRGWRLVPHSRKLAYKGHAMYFYTAPTKAGQVRAVSVPSPGYRPSVSRPVTFPLHH